MLAKIADEQLKISHIEASFTIGRLNDKIIGISARSVDRFNVQAMMEKLGGGGHLNNAATQIEATQVKTVKATLIGALDAFDEEGEKMKVILLKDVKNKGRKDEVIEVAAGYGNYLVSSKLAVPASDDNIDALKAKQAQQKADEIKELADAKALKERIDFRAVKLPVKVGEKGKLFAKVNTKMIADAFKEQHDMTLDKRKIQLTEKIESLGTYKVEIKLHKDVTATFEVVVTQE
jgi:ribosomal protein L9